MRYTSAAALAAALMVGGGGTALAQGSGQQLPGYGPRLEYGTGQQYGTDQPRGAGVQFGTGQQYGTDQPRRPAPGGQQFGQGGFGGRQLGPQARRSGFQERSALRQQLRQVGFQNIRILDAAYLVQARMRDGRPVLMVIDPPAQMMQSGRGQEASGQ